MKSKSMFFVAAALAAAACTKTGVTSSHEENSFVDVTFDFSLPATKAVGNGDNVDNAVKSVQIFVFDKDGRIQSYASNTGKSVKVTCTTGQKKIAGIVNAPDLSSATSLSDLQSRTAWLADNASDALVMDKLDNYDISASGTLPIEVTRHCAKVLLSKVSVDFTLDQYKTSPVEIKSIFLTNVAADGTYVKDSGTTSWINKMGLDAEAPSVVKETLTEVSVNNLNTHSTVHRLYCLPNPTSTDSFDGTWSPRHTRLVVETAIGGVTYYYPVTLPVIERNKVYDVSLTITRPGFDSPENPSTILEPDFNVTVTPWGETTSLTETI